MKAYYDNVLARDIEVAKNDCTKAKGIMPRALGWARQAQLLGAFDEQVQTIMDALVDSLVTTTNPSTNASRRTIPRRSHNYWVSYDNWRF